VSQYFERNRRAWDAESDAYQARHGSQLAGAAAAWGVWSLPEDDLNLLGEVRDRDVLEYGCGAAQWSIALARRGARVTGLDNSARQLDYACAAVAAAGLEVRLVHAPGEATPFAAAAFDIVFCDHGAMSFAAPEETIPEVARILRSDGLFVFSVAHPLHAACWDDAAGGVTAMLVQPYFSLEATVDADDGSVSFARPISVYAALLDASGFTIERLLEPRPATDAKTSYTSFVPHAWARDFPAELIIRARRA
jgi:SAM-dependent methyltransferase